jgi:hypothetical protein
LAASRFGDIRASRSFRFRTNPPETPQPQVGFAFLKNFSLVAKLDAAGRLMEVLWRMLP